MDLGDRTSHICVLDEGGRVVERGKVPTTQEGMRKRFEGAARMRIAMEVGTHSPWVSRRLKGFGHEVLVANPRKTRLIYQSRGKQDAVDAEALARIARLDPKLLYPVEHRPEGVAEDLAVLRARDVLVRTRTQLVNHVRGAVKATGHRLKKCSARTFSEKAVDEIPEEVGEALSSVVATIEAVSKQILQLDKRIAELGKKKYPETALLRQVGGVGPIVALAYILTLEHPGRFRKSRAVGPYLGLVPARSQSGESDPQLRITKEGDAFLRRLLVQSAQYVLGPFGPDCDLRRAGLSLSARGERNAKKRAVIAVARKLAVLLHRLWKSAEVYEPLRKARALQDATVAA
ncbi:MAG: IS110 family transposase [Acidobacteria bacterium]|nr:IS110 family transposase [Acidobacteriota bacterium]